VLRGAGVGRLDAMVLSHEDLDHIGGALTVMETVQVDALASSLPSQHALQALSPASRRCAAGTAWEWDGVRFEFLHPAASETAFARRNNLSCVLRIATAGGSMILTGDIERAAEGALLKKENSLKSDVLLVPHHGSRTSSTEQFIAAVSPRWAVVPVGYRNRFGHPNREVMDRYRDAGADIVRTDLGGAVRVLLTGRDVQVTTERARQARYWRTPPRV
jgi:competence protein ComEC